MYKVIGIQGLQIILTRNTGTGSFAPMNNTFKDEFPEAIGHEGVLMGL